MEKIRTLIREMIEKRYEALQNEKPELSEERVPNTVSNKAITDEGDPIKDVKLNKLVKNPLMSKNGAKPHVNHGQPSKSD